MAERRMFAKTIVLSDAFLDMPLSARCLYFTLGMLADDDGFVNSPKSIMRQCGAAQDDLRILFERRFLLPFDSGVIVIKHWRINNYLQKDRYRPTIYSDEKAQLDVDEKGAYTESKKQDCIQDVYNMYTQDRLGKDIDRAIEESYDSSSPEPQAPPVLTLTLNDKSEYPIMQKDVDTWTELYPNVDVMQQLRNMRGWCMENPSKRKTAKGIRRFIVGWLSREQDRGGSRPARGQPAQSATPSYDINQAIEKARMLDPTKTKRGE